MMHFLRQRQRGIARPVLIVVIAVLVIMIRQPPGSVAPVPPNAQPPNAQPPSTAVVTETGTLT